MKLKLILLAATLAFSLSLQAGEKAVSTEKPSFSATQTLQLTASVVDVDREALTVTLKGPEGNTRTLEARAENLKKINVGDTVNVEYVQNMTIEVFANDGMEPGAGVIGASAENVEGETPAAMEMITTVATATVEAIDLEAYTFKLKWPNGEIKEYDARDPENLKKADVGDLVVTTYTEAIALTLNDITDE